MASRSQDPAASWLTERDRLETLARTIEPSVRLTSKETTLWRLVAFVTQLITFGAVGRTVFLERYATTLGPIQGYPPSWTVAQVEGVLIHEARHTWQARMCGLGLHPWLGLPIFGVLYLLAPLPMGLGIARLLFEVDAERTVWRHFLARGATPEAVLQRAEAFAAVVCSRDYGWSAPQRFGRAVFLRAARREIAASETQRPVPT
jgi:hypothetical protein